MNHKLTVLGKSSISNFLRSCQSFENYQLLNYLKKLNIWDDTAIIISADHGENQGELNVWGDHQTADHITNRVPLIIKWPGVTDNNKGNTVDNKFYNLDLMLDEI